MWKTLVTIALPDLHSASIFCKTPLNNHFQQILQKTWPCEIRRPGWVWMFLLDHLATYRLLEQMLGVGVSKSRSRQWNSWHEGIGLDNTPFLMARFRKMLYRTTIYQLEEDAKRGNSLDRQRKRHVRDNEENETGWSFVQLALSSTRCSKWHLKMLWNVGKKRKAWAYVWEFLCLIASQTCVLLTTCSCSLFRWCSSKKWCATSSRVPRVQDWTSTRTRRTFLSKQRTNKSNKWRWTTLKLRYYLRVRVRHVFCKQVRFSNRKSRDHKFESELVQHRAPDTNKSWHQDRASCNTDSAYSTWRITPTLSYVSGTLTPSKEHQRLIRSTQRKMLRFNFQTKRKYRNKTRTSKKEKD